MKSKIDSDRDAKLKFIEQETGQTIDDLAAWAESIAKRMETLSPELGDELPGAALLGLAVAIERYDPDPREGHKRAPRFRPYAKRVIVGHVLDEVRRWARQDGRGQDAERLAVRWAGLRAKSLYSTSNHVAEDDAATLEMAATARWSGSLIESVLDRGGPSPEAIVEQRDEVRSVLASIDPRAAQLLRRVHLDGLRIRDAAGELGLSETAAGVHLRRAREHLAARGERGRAATKGEGRR